MLSGIAPLGALSDELAGDVLFHEGEQHAQIYFVCDGSVALEMHAPGRGSKRILTIGAGEILASSVFLGDGRMTATAVALENAKLISIPGSELMEGCNRDHGIGYAIMRWFAKAIARRLLATRLQLMDVFGDNAS